MRKTIETQVRLPKQMIDEVKAIAKLAGLSPDLVIQVALATEVRRWQKVGVGRTAQSVEIQPQHDQAERYEK